MADLIDPLFNRHGNVNSFLMEDKHFYLRNSHLLFPEVQRRLLAWKCEELQNDQVRGPVFNLWGGNCSAHPAWAKPGFELHQSPLAGLGFRLGQKEEKK